MQGDRGKRLLYRGAVRLFSILLIFSSFFHTSTAAIKGGCLSLPSIYF